MRLLKARHVDILWMTNAPHTVIWLDAFNSSALVNRMLCKACQWLAKICKRVCGQLCVHSFIYPAHSFVAVFSSVRQARYRFWYILECMLNGVYTYSPSFASEQVSRRSSLVFVSEFTSSSVNLIPPKIGTQRRRILSRRLALTCMELSSPGRQTTSWFLARQLLQRRPLSWCSAIANRWSESYLSSLRL